MVLRTIDADGQTHFQRGIDSDSGVEQPAASYR